MSAQDWEIVESAISEGIDGLTYDRDSFYTAQIALSRLRKSVDVVYLEAQKYLDLNYGYDTLSLQPLADAVSVRDVFRTRGEPTVTGFWHRAMRALNPARSPKRTKRRGAEDIRKETT